MRGEPLEQGRDTGLEFARAIVLRTLEGVQPLHDARCAEEFGKRVGLLFVQLDGLAGAIGIGGVVDHQISKAAAIRDDTDSSARLGHEFMP